MALTQSAWTKSTVNDRFVAICTVTATTSESDAYTLKTPVGLDTTKPFTLGLQCSTAPDNGAVTVDLWAGYSDNFALSGDAANVVATGTGGKAKQLLDTAIAAVTPLIYWFRLDPYLGVADVVTAAAIDTGLKVEIPIAPYYAFNLNGGTLIAHTATWIIIQ